MRVYVHPADHAFASGQVFLENPSLLASWKETGALDAALRLRAVWKQFRRDADFGEKLRLGVNARIVSENPQKVVEIGDNTAIRGILRVERGGSLKIGSFVYIGDGAIVSAQESVEIGDLTLIAHGAQIFDNDSHPVPADQREAHFKRMMGVKTGVPYKITSKPVRIGRRCWLGFNSAVMKGVTIGEDSIVASMAVVVENVPPRVVVAGNPARVIKHLDV